MKSIESKFTVRTSIEHARLTPDMFIGSTSNIVDNTWIYDSENNRIVYKTIAINYAFNKLFDEIITNAIDQYNRYPDLVDEILVSVNMDTGFISVKNGGPGIDVAKHEEYNEYVPTIIFTYMFAGENYTDTSDNKVAGKNGLGAKLTNIYSDEFTIETVDSVRGKYFSQTCHDQLLVVDKPVVRSSKAKSYTKITYKPKYSVFGMDKLDKEKYDMIYRRTIDAAALCGKARVMFNGRMIRINSMAEYLRLVSPHDKIRYLSEDESWEVIVGLSGNGPLPIKSENLIANCDKFTQLSFVNGAFTDIGGQHVQHVVTKIVNKLSKFYNSQYSNDMIKNVLLILINLKIKKPIFESQAKRKLDMNVRDLGTAFEFNDPEGVDKVLKLSQKLKLLSSKDKVDIDKELRKCKKASRYKVIDVPKLIDAPKSKCSDYKERMQCTLVITEGDSASSFVHWGLTKLKDKKDYYGIFPIRGIMINVMNATEDQITKNAEIQNLMKIILLNRLFTYESDEQYQTLKYGHIMVVADADPDGYHITSLVALFIYTFWPHLYNRGFIRTMVTPLIYIEELSKYFYTKDEYLEAYNKGGIIQKYKAREIKGLGGHENINAAKIFNEMVLTEFYKDEKTYRMIKVAFQNSAQMDVETGRKMSDTRKNIIDIYKKMSPEDKVIKTKFKSWVTIPETFDHFFNTKLLIYYDLDIVRSIPNMLDGLKVSQRKVLYSCLENRIFKEKKIRVSQLAGKITDLTNYHHGETSLHECIICLAQNYIGANNINLLYPDGEFGTRMSIMCESGSVAGVGKNSAAPRYIHTYLEQLTNVIYSAEDNSVLTHIDEEGQIIEPYWFCPIVPMILINGANGIATGYSTFIPQFDPLVLVDTIVKILTNNLTGNEENELIPYYRGYKGSIFREVGNKFISCGKMEFSPDYSHITITEIPIGNNLSKSFLGYDLFLKNLLAGKEQEPESDDVSVKVDIKPTKKVFKSAFIDAMDDYENHCNPIFANFVIYFDKEKLKQLVQTYELDDFYSLLELKQYISLNNMHVLVPNITNNSNYIKKYESIMDILYDFISIRLYYYDIRIINILNDTIYKLECEKAKHKFIKDVSDKVFELKTEPAEEMIVKFRKHEYLQFSGGQIYGPDDMDINGGYNHLLEIKISSFTDKKLASIENNINELSNIVEYYDSINNKELWRKELANFKIKYCKFVDDWNKRINDILA